ncbi:hypothetical protein ZOD2009_15746 [Haladaptatus paucihalophilus DX253]|uniref:Uncharacterized protein n=1 Tax=Haladaptatus paucihalophilus DX253 TaxID=797209 RepID=E7QWG1_HALPU|nr:hypothetical protein [Haladaptatus paucihalophilus]EFW91057.1 hypothetical protein ZOD2009_15746 [Haladaptatus paucihalophilus DX253]SHL38517.1 hypothetical protein SAMN05444342_3733 [Haladaptatus paucihalophilus DX253]
MPNTIKRSGDGLALQVTKPARAAELVEEADDEPTRLADIRVFAFDGLLLVVDLDRITDENIVELATSAPLDTVSIHRVANASLQIAGNGYQVQLPGAADAGFHVGDRAPCTPAPNLLVIAADESGRVAADIATIRREQV